MSGSSNSISHSKNTNKGYVRMTGGPQFGVPQQISSQPQEINYSKPIQRKTGTSANISEGASKPVRKGKKKDRDSLLNQYSHNLPPTQIEYQSGFQDIPPPMLNPGESTLKKKVQAKVLPGNSDLEDLDGYYNDIRLVYSQL